MSTIKSSDEHLTLNADGSSKDIKLQSNASEKVIVKSDGKVGIGTSSPNRLLTLYGDTGIALQNSTTGTGNSNGTHIWVNSSGSGELIIQNRENSDIEFLTNDTERMRIDSSGNVGIGGTPSDKLDVFGGVAMFRRSDVNSSQAERIVGFKDGGGTERGSIKISNSAVTYTTGSDYRLKENVDYDWDATTRLKQLKPARFNFIQDETNTLVDGFIAHEVSSVVPEAISGEKDAFQVWEAFETLPEGVSVGDNKLDDDGNRIPLMQSIDQSKLVPLLVKTIQELEARITALEA
jgi:hypothetical protein